VKDQGIPGEGHDRRGRVVALSLELRGLRLRSVQTVQPRRRQGPARPPEGGKGNLPKEAPRHQIQRGTGGSSSRRDPVARGRPRPTPQGATTSSKNRAANITAAVPTTSTSPATVTTAASPPTRTCQAGEHTVPRSSIAAAGALHRATPVASAAASQGDESTAMGRDRHDRGVRRPGTTSRASPPGFRGPGASPCALTTRNPGGGTAARPGRPGD
jgi:hypothetical protein